METNLTSTHEDDEDVGSIPWPGNFCRGRSPKEIAKRKKKKKTKGWIDLEGSWSSPTSHHLSSLGVDNSLENLGREVKWTIVEVIEGGKEYMNVCVCVYVCVCVCV